jgi:endonuclease/exonuclease/phosphatase family metal-dependent hydrolase
VDVRLTQREVILALKSPDLKLAKRPGRPVRGTPDRPDRDRRAGLAAVGLGIGGRESHGQSFRFATTHLDPIPGAAQQGQANQFLAGPGSTALPMVWIGDFNSDADETSVTRLPPATATYGSVIASGFSDAWRAKHPSDPAFTCCQATDLMNAAPTLSERDDLVLTREFHVAKASIVGDEATDRLPSGLWPSDHAGVVVTLELKNDV